MRKSKIIIVEDDEITSQNLNISLEKQGYSVVSVCNSVLCAYSKINMHNPDILIIDISLDEKSDGIELAKVIRQDYQIPFIFLTSYTDNDIIAQATLTEPYGYVVKPFNPDSLHATIQMALFKFSQENMEDNYAPMVVSDKLNIERLLNSRKNNNESIVKFGDFYYLNITTHETFYHEKKIRLTQKENSFLRLLVGKMGSNISFEEAVHYVWKKNGATTNNVRTLVWRLRKKLPSDIIKNASGFGYYILPTNNKH